MNESYVTAAETALSSAKWLSRPNDARWGETGWPELRTAERCDGENPMTGSVCIQGRHKGYHRDASGAEWLDD